MTTRPTTLTAPNTRDRWRRAALVLAAHRAIGATAGAEPVRRWARLLARRGLFADVRVGFVKGEPTLADAVAEAVGQPVYVVPFFMADGYFVRKAIPQALESLADCSPHLCPPLGTSPRLARIAGRMARSACRRLSVAADRTGLLVVAHGTPREPASSEVARALAAALAAEGTFAGAAAAFLEDSPSVAEALGTLPGSAVATIGLFASAGTHGADDVVRLLGEAADSRPAVHAGTIGEASGMIGAVLERLIAAEAADRD